MEVASGRELLARMAGLYCSRKRSATCWAALQAYRLAGEACPARVRLIAQSASNASAYAEIAESLIPARLPIERH